MGTTFVVGERLEYPPVTPLIVEADPMYFQYNPQLSDRSDRFVLPELRLQGNSAGHLEEFRRSWIDLG